jgi:hypothetical protein
LAVEHPYLNGVGRPHYTRSAQERGADASGVGRPLLKDVAQIVEKLHPVLHGCLVEQESERRFFNTAALDAVPSRSNE